MFRSGEDPTDNVNDGCIKSLRRRAPGVVANRYSMSDGRFVPETFISAKQVGLNGEKGEGTKKDGGIKMASFVSLLRPFLDFD